ncbi:hypothetical protein Poli38472_007836 [Pythium oligandrum]|uniref:Uncharacterized protein n=1 Tax=Pythium oligandrum TaxID=41045 RepID=A0A8K1CRZ7_PYTOL|nr:hypothetical protein Poli38472_007836 [Pythium oligandrum]|eukprot:TMW68164.1 hypothetical protein Poli38472_007836 [Pythium oligandrum]
MEISTHANEGEYAKLSTSPRQPTPRRKHVKTWKESLQVFLEGYGGVVLELVNVGLSIALVVIAVITSYDHPGLDTTDVRFNWFEAACTLVFLVDFLLHCVAADNPIRYLFTIMAVIDLITIVPISITWLLRAVNVAILTIVHMVRVFRLLSALRLYRIVKWYRGFDYELGVLILIIFTVIFVSGGIFQMLDEDYYRDNGQPDLEFHQAIYFVFVTISTVGYGDISPETTASRMFVIVVICVVGTVIPRQVNRLLELSRLYHSYMHSYPIRKRSILNGGHVIITGNINYVSVSEFLVEFYRSRQGKVNMDVVILADEIPSKRLAILLRNIRYQRRTTYIKGSLLNAKDAERAHLDAAAAVFILANRKKIKHADAADALTILQALAVDKLDFRHRGLNEKKSDHQHRRRGTRCFVQILSPQRTRGLRTIAGVEVALNTPRLRTAILARSIVCPGATALILNLICSTPEEHVTTAQQSNVPWISEYAEGLEHQLFPVILPRAYDGVQYENALLTFYTNFNVLLIAVYDKYTIQVGNKRIRLAPFGHVLHERNLAFFIAPSASHAQHAVDSLSLWYAHRHDAALQRTEAPKDGSSMWPPLQTIMFSSDTVLDRQSMTRDSTPSVDLSSDEDASGHEEDNDLRDLLKRMDDDKDQAEIDNKAPPSPPLESTTNSPIIFSSSLRSSSNTRGLPKLRSQADDWSLSPAALRRLRDHIIICGPFAQGHQLAGYLDELYRNERRPAPTSSSSEGQSRQSDRPLILLLVKRLPSDQDLEDLSTPLPPNVFVERGVSQNAEDLVQVRAHLAKAVIMIPGNWKHHADELRDETKDEVTEHLLDYQVVMSTLSLRTVQELHHEHLQRSMGNSKSTMMIGRRREPTIACSVVKWHDSLTFFAHKSNSYASQDSDAKHQGSQIDPVLSHDKWSRTHRLHHAMREATRRVHHRDTSRDIHLSFAPSYAAGEVFVDSALDTLLCQSFFNPYVIDLVRALTGDYYYYADYHHSCTTERTAPTDGSCDNQAEAAEMLEHPVLSVASISEELEGKSFVTIFQHALRQQVLILGIFRRANDSHRGNTLPYVYTCPKSHAGITVERGDTLHVLTCRAARIVRV